MEYRKHLLKIDVGNNINTIKEHLLKLGCKQIIIGETNRKHTELSIKYLERFEKAILSYIESSPEIHLVA